MEENMDDMTASMYSQLMKSIALSSPPPVLVSLMKAAIREYEQTGDFVPVDSVASLITYRAIQHSKRTDEQLGEILKNDPPEQDHGTIEFDI